MGTAKASASRPQRRERSMRRGWPQSGHGRAAGPKGATWVAPVRGGRKDRDPGSGPTPSDRPRKRVAILPSEKPGTLEHGFWRSVNTREAVLTGERGRITRLSRTRQKVDRVRVLRTLADWALKRGMVDGFDMLLEQDIPEFLDEGVVLRHPDKFGADIVAAARNRLEAAGVGMAKATAYR